MQLFVKMRRLIVTTVSAAVLAPVFVLAAGTSANATLPQHGRLPQCMKAYDMNYNLGGKAFATAQLRACLGA